MEHISYPKIGQFRNIISDLRRDITFIKLDDTGNAIYNQNIVLPKITFKGTIKLHGTNASVCYNRKDGLYFQSKNKIITPLNDNAEFAKFANQKSKSFIKLIEDIRIKHNLSINDTITIYGEWAGKGVQNGVGVSELDKAFYIFGIKVKYYNCEKKQWLISNGYSDIHNRIYNTQDFKTFSVEVDFNNPEYARNEFIKYVEYVEKECPIAKSLGIKNGIGEGIVWTAKYNDKHYFFKTKGQKHSSSKIKKVASINMELVESIKEFVEYSVTDNRFNQGLKEIYPDDDYIPQKLGLLIKWIINDILTEELDVLNKNGLEPKNIGGKIAQEIKQRFFKL